MIKQEKKSLLNLPRIVVLVLLVVLALCPHFLGVKNMTTLSRILVFAVYAMAYDVLRGYTGFIHLGFALFVGGGAYFVGIMFTQIAVTIPVLLLAVAATVLYSVLWSLLISKIAATGGSLLATAMITMAFGEIVRNLMERLRSISNGTDGLSFRLPKPLDNRMVLYYICLLFLVVMVIVLRKFVNSPTGRVLQGIRENEQRAIFLGYDTVKARTIALVVAGITAGLAGVMYGLLNRFVNTDALGMQMTYNAMLYSLIGGTGTLYGAIVGSGVVIIFQDILLNLRGVAPIFERWLLFFGALYIVVIMYMPHGIVGFFNTMKEKRRQKQPH